MSPENTIPPPTTVKVPDQKATTDKVAAPENAAEPPPSTAHTVAPEPTLCITDPPCPRCQSALSVEGGRLPELCPACNYILRAQRPHALNHNFRLAFRKALVWKGRATRREFWGFAIIMGALGLVPALALDILCRGAVSERISEYIAPIPTIPPMLWYIVTPMLAAAMLIWVLALPLPLISLTIRRLHDVGHSMRWLTAALVFWGGAAIAFSVSGISMLIALLTGADSCSAETPTLNIALEYSTIAALALGSMATVFSLAIIMFSLMDSQRGTNKYGPSAKYPLE